MKKTILAVLLLTLIILQGCGTMSVTTMSNSKARSQARFLTDRMAYELDFTPMQYDDCYEINHDFLYAVSFYMDDASRGYYDAIDNYYRYLDYRNQDLRYIMTARQYDRFLARDYFYRPIYVSGSSWDLRVYSIYNNRSFYYYDAPTIYRNYAGAHSRKYYTNGYYNSRYESYDHYAGDPRIHGSAHFNDHRQHDFGANLRTRNSAYPNHYKNTNSNNRTKDARYTDKSGNTNSPQINNRTTRTTSTNTQPKGNTPPPNNNVSQPSKPNSNGGKPVNSTSQPSRQSTPTATQTGGTRSSRTKATR